MTTWTIDDETLRETPADAGRARARVRELEALGPEGDAERIAWLRVLGSLEEAEDVGWAALERAGGPGSAAAAELVTRLPLAAVAPALRVAHVLQWQGRYPAAHGLFEAALASAELALTTAEPGSREQRAAEAMRAFAHQHWGKCFYDEGRYGAALVHFEAALRLRTSSGAPEEQVASTRQAIGAARRRLGR